MGTRLILIAVTLALCAGTAAATEVKSLEAAQSLAGQPIPLQADITGATATIEMSTAVLRGALVFQRQENETRRLLMRF